ncbi:hypothetical protein BKP37_10535 [Anaerobacillus alkalilacustris]|uniref:DUF4349 domain-containing protein n=1 Tax=Anaerobacillus alkalilacustris TaxID=393763 RepID=A0A1S2LM38_9BACI|nr:DUF4349 domain-containing protein [Anaerobacillus alkalilacustris]OIJ13404.1 hypothetical protein BKP37_10535 [Anaerobacillus alkalilacustris]
MQKVYNAVFIFISIFLVAGCSSNESQSIDGGYAGIPMVMEEAVMDKETVPIQEGFRTTETIEEQRLNSTERMVIYNANLSLEVNDYEQVEANIQQRVNAIGGYVVESSIYFSGEDRINGNLVVKVPQKSFHSFIHEVESVSIKVQDRHVSGNDVTEEYIDLDARLRSKRVVEARLLDFMEKAEQTEDLLKISSDLAKVQEEIEQLVGRINYLQTNVDYSTVSIYLTEKLVKIPTIQDKEVLNTWVKAKSLFMDSINGLMSFFSTVIILAIGLSPVFIPLAILVLFMVIYVRKKRGNNPFEG